MSTFPVLCLDVIPMLRAPLRRGWYCMKTSSHTATMQQIRQGGKLCNAFDLVRIHRFGLLDEEAPPDTTGTGLPSYKAMVGFAQEDKETKLTLGRERKEEACADFEGEEDDSWLASLEVDKSGRIKNSLNNVLVILQHDESLKHIVFNQMADNLEIKGTCPGNAGEVLAGRG